ncbi:class I SAM-dependent methyltransferase [Streptomyces albofaciens JCM 4342]|uniref:class I SAM-dependent methyltransferase n=1 Tax=Streptomyces albofaciens TaxID=66866 RepID=UPI0012398165|nr:class I SAM-dependent methyltransferase [Streptomyces albofaciens]KAA6220863.1 class I SAM-dependent methyltransferase [Streptomyces albofaciens JCM 4342]
MFSPQGPTLRELTAQALSSVERGYDLLAPKFDHTPFRTPGRILDATAEALCGLGPSEGRFGAGLDVCCGTGAGIGVLRSLCRERVVGVDFSAGMLAEAQEAEYGRTSGPAVAYGHSGTPTVTYIRADARTLPFTTAFDLAVTFGALGHFLPAERAAVFAGVHRALRPGGIFAFPIAAPPPPRSALYWTLLGFDAVMRVRNALWRPPFVMYYRTSSLGAVRADLRAAGFGVEVVPVQGAARRPDGSPAWGLVVARKP